MKASRRTVNVLYYLTVLFGLAVLTISLAKLLVIGWSQAISALWVVAVFGVSFLLYHALKSDIEIEKLGEEYAIVKQELENLERMRAETRTRLHTHHESVVNRMRIWKYWPRETGEMIYVVPEGGRPLLTTEPANLQNDKKHLEGFPAAWKIYQDAPIVYGVFREAEEAASGLIAARLQALNTNSLLIARQEADGSFRRLTKEIVQELDAEIRSSRRQALLLKLEPKRVIVPQSARIEGDGGGKSQLPQLLLAIKASEDVRGLIESRLEAWDRVEANKNAFLRALSVDVLGPAENGNWEGFEKGDCGDCRFLKEKLLAFERIEGLPAGAS